MAITHMFKGSKGINGYGYYAYIENAQLVIGESWPREGGETYRGSFEDIPAHYVRELEEKATALINDIRRYLETNKIDNTCAVRYIGVGNMFKHDSRLYTVINANVAPYACAYVIDESGKEMYLVPALDMESYRVQFFAKNLNVERYHK